MSIDRLQHNFSQPTFLRGQYSFTNLRDFLQGRASQFQGFFPGSVILRGMRTTMLGAYIQDDFRWRPNLTLNLGLRYETMTTPQEVNGLQSQLLNLDDRQFAVGKPYFNHPGHSFQPRIGVAWNPDGKGKTSLRAGFGTYSDVLVGNFWVTSASQSYPFVMNGQIINPPPESFPRAYALVQVATILAVLRVTPDANFPVRAQYNLSLQHELLPQTVITIAYTGGVGRHSVRTGEPNVRVPTLVDGRKFWPSATAPLRNTAFGSLLTYNTDANSNYNSLQISGNRRFSRGLQIQSSYTFGHSIDDFSQQLGSEGNSNPNNHTDSTIGGQIEAHRSLTCAIISTSTPLMIFRST